jgi:hypothetical protein
MSFVKKIISDDWSGTKSNNLESPGRTVEDAIDAVKQLNGRNHTQVVLKGEDRVLIVGGGNEGRYSVVLAFGDDEAFCTLVNPESTSTQDVIIVTGGQAGAFPQNQCVTLDAAIAAVSEFFDSGEPSRALAWERE